MDQLILGVFAAIGFIVLLLILGTMNQTESPHLRVGIGTHPEPRPIELRPHGDQRAQPRWLEKVKADTGGYFWLPCPLCGENFGGHEWAGTLMTTPTNGTGVCANCTDEAARLSDLMYERAGYVLDMNPPLIYSEARREWVPVRQWINPSRWSGSPALDGATGCE